MGPIQDSPSMQTPIRNLSEMTGAGTTLTVSQCSNCQELREICALLREKNHRLTQELEALLKKIEGHG